MSVISRLKHVFVTPAFTTSHGLFFGFSGYRGAAARADQLLDKMEAKYLAGDMDLKPNTFTYNAVSCVGCTLLQALVVLWHLNPYCLFDCTGYQCIGKEW